MLEILKIVKVVQVDVDTIKHTQSEFAERITKLEAFAIHSDATTQDLKKSQEKIEEENGKLTKRVEILEQALKEVRIQQKEEAKLRDDVDFNNRKYNLEMSGIPSAEKEDPALPLTYAKKMMELVGATSSPDSLDIAHRKFNGGIIMRFTTRSARDEVFDKRFNLKGISSVHFGFAQPAKGNPIFVNESLSHDRSILMQQIRIKLKLINQERAKEDRFKMHSANGRVRVMDQQREWRTVSSLMDFERLHPGLW